MQVVQGSLIRRPSSAILSTCAFLTALVPFLVEYLGQFSLLYSYIHKNNRVFNYTMITANLDVLCVSVEEVFTIGVNKAGNGVL